MKIFILLFMTASLSYAGDTEVSIEKLKDGRVVKVIRTTQYQFLDQSQIDQEITEKQDLKQEVVSAKPATQDTEDLVK